MADWELVLKRNPVERIKQERAPLGIREELPALIAAGYEAVAEEDVVRLQWWGLYHDKPKIGTFMLRVKIPSGILTLAAGTTSHQAKWAGAGLAPSHWSAVPSCSSAVEAGSYPPRPTQNAEDDTRPGVQEPRGSRHVAVTSVNATGTAGAAATAA